jgi:hypothetical protein
MRQQRNGMPAAVFYKDFGYASGLVKLRTIFSAHIISWNNAKRMTTSFALT